MSEDEESDETLMARVAAGDERAFARLAERHSGRMLRLAQRTLGSAAEADEVAQEALLRVWQHARRFRPERARLATWIYAIVYRLAIDRLRRPRTLPLELAMEIEDAAPDALEAMSRASELARLAAAMATLQPRQRAALTLFYYDELEGAEAAAVLGVSLRAFWSLLHRARQSLQQQMQVPAGLDVGTGTP